MRSLVAERLEVWALARDSRELEVLASETGCHRVECDLTDDAATDVTLGGLEIDVLVNNAGLISAVKPFAELPREVADHMLALNLRAPLNVMRRLLPGMIARAGGHGRGAGVTKWRP